MLVRSRRAATFAIGAALIALAAACTNPTAPAARSNGGIAGDGVTVGGGTHTVSTSGVTVGGGT